MKNIKNIFAGLLLAATLVNPADAAAKRKQPEVPELKPAIKRVRLDLPDFKELSNFAQREAAMAGFKGAYEIEACKGSENVEAIATTFRAWGKAIDSFGDYVTKNETACDAKLLEAHTVSFKEADAACLDTIKIAADAGNIEQPAARIEEPAAKVKRPAAKVKQPAVPVVRHAAHVEVEEVTPHAPAARPIVREAHRALDQHESKHPCIAGTVRAVKKVIRIVKWGVVCWAVVVVAGKTLHFVLSCSQPSYAACPYIFTIQNFTAPRLAFLMDYIGAIAERTIVLAGPALRWVVDWVPWGLHGIADQIKKWLIVTQ